MSRSFKKTPVVKDRSRGMKAVANRVFRRKKVIVANGNAYRKVFCSYNISDWAFRETYREYLARAELSKRAYENGINSWKYCRFNASHWDWYKMYLRK